MVRLYELKRELNKMRMAVAPLQDVLAQLRRYQGDLIPDEVKLYVRDVHDHAVRISDVIDTLREMLGTALSVNLSLVTLAQGETVKRLGAWAALLAAPTLITSWYGMNFSHMPELSQPWSYPLMIVGVGGVCVGLYRLFKRAKWFVARIDQRSIPTMHGVSIPGNPVGRAVGRGTCPASGSAGRWPATRAMPASGRTTVRHQAT